MPCPRCKATDTRTLTTAGGQAKGCARVECVKCGRFVRWEAVASEVREEISATRSLNKSHNSQSASDQPEELGQPELWLYTSRRLALEFLPNVPMWSLPVVTLGDAAAPVAFYRLSARTLVWLEKAGEQLEAKVMRGEVERDQLDAYLAAMTVVWEFAAAHLDPESVRAARGKPAELPVAEGPK